MIETKNIQDVIKTIAINNPKIIGVDGINGAGKSCFTGILSSCIDYFYISLDDYVQNNMGGFANYINIPLLRHNLCGHKNIIIEGVCLLDALINADISADMIIYIKRVKGIPTKYEWEDAEELEYAGDVEELIAKEDATQMFFDQSAVEFDGKEIPKEKSEISALAKEIYRYHARVKPQRIADIIFLRFA